MREFFPSLLKKQQGNDRSSEAVSSRWLALALLCLAQFMVVLDVQIAERQESFCLSAAITLVQKRVGSLSCSSNESHAT